VFDLSGNVKEWAMARSPGVNPLRGGASNNTPVGISCAFNFPLATDTILFPNIGFRCCRTVWNSGSCQTFTAPATPLDGINNGTVTSTITIPALAGTISDFNILGLTGTTDRFQDMRFSIASPTGTVVQIINSARCGTDDNWSFNVDDAAVAPNLVNTDAPFCNGTTLMGGGTTYHGVGNLSTYNTLSPSGAWTLTMQDVSGTGVAPQLTGWSIQVCRQ
jgi:hypothetical protein